MSAAEGMAAGLPILVSDYVPVGAWAKKAFSGEIAAYDRGSFSSAAITMLSDPIRLKAMGRNGKVAAVELFSQQAVAEEMRIQLELIIARAKNQIFKSSNL
jgi:glycosyltransferase involved in cell wall biosynthesis